MSSKITIFDHFCHPLIEVTNIPTTARSWLLNDYGRADLNIGYDPTVPQSGQLANEKYLQFGNLIHIEHIPSVDENGKSNGKLPDWTGVILPPRDWDLGIVHVSVYQIEALLDFRAMPYVHSTGSPATVFRDIINKAQARAKNIPIQIGNVDNINKTYSDELRLSAYKHIKKLCADSGMDWNIEGRIKDNGTLDLRANLYTQRGIDTPFVMTNQNSELEGNLLNEQGTPANYVFGYSQANTKESRYSVVSDDTESVDDYGPLELNAVFVGRRDKVSTQNATDERIENRSRPVKLIKQRTALDKKTFNYLSVGNTFTIKDSNAGFSPNGGYGFESTVKILSMDYNDISNKVRMNLKVIRR